MVGRGLPANSAPMNMASTRSAASSSDELGGGRARAGRRWRRRTYSASTAANPPAMARQGRVRTASAAASPDLVALEDGAG